ncbi:MAG: BON domain-containing protein [Pseudomonadota bacterium]
MKAAATLIYSLLLIHAALTLAAKPPAASSQAGGCHGLGDGSLFKDEATAFKITSKLQFNKALMREKIDVKSSGGIITLSGNVSTPEQIKLAEKITREVKDVHCVNNFLKVGPPLKDSTPYSGG